MAIVTFALPGERYAIWCEVWGNLSRARGAWLARDGVRTEYPTRDAAELAVANWKEAVRNLPMVFRFTVRSVGSTCEEE